MQSIAGALLAPTLSTVIAAAASQRIAFNGAVYASIATGTKGVWYKLGDSTVVATAGTAAEGYAPVNYATDIPRGSTAVTHIAIIQEAATAVGSVTMYG